MPITHWLGQALVIIVVPIVQKANGGNADVVFFGLGGIQLILFIINAIFMIETKDKTRRQIQD